MKQGNTVTRLGVNISSSLITAIIRITVLVWINQYLLRRIAPEEYALLPVITSLMVIVELIPIIFNQGVHRFMVAADARADEDRLVSVVSSMVPVLASLSALVLIGGGLAAFWISALIRVDPIYVNDARLMLLLLVLGLALQIGSTPFRVGLSVKMRFVEQNLILLATESLRVLLLLVLIFGIGPQDTLGCRRQQLRQHAQHPYSHFLHVARAACGSVPRRSDLAPDDVATDQLFVVDTGPNFQPGDPAGGASAVPEPCRQRGRCCLVPCRQSRRRAA